MPRLAACLSLSFSVSVCFFVSSFVPSASLPACFILSPFLPLFVLFLIVENRICGYLLSFVALLILFLGLVIRI